MKKTIKIFMILFIILSLFSGMYCVNATEDEDKSFSVQDIFSKGDAFIGAGKDPGSQALSDSEISAIFVPIAQVLVKAGTIVLAVAVVILGIQYMVASPDKKAALKDRLVGLAIAAIVIGGAQAIWALLIGFFE